jgi:thiamine-phosphate pyrophosphorylase
MIFNNIKKFFFISNLTENISNNILKFKNIHLIYRPNCDFDFTELKKIKQFCRKNRIELYLTNNYKLAIKYKLNGTFLTSSNRDLITNSYNKRKFKLIGVAHNIREYLNKKKQFCDLIFLSPLFYNDKHSINNIIGTCRFRTICMLLNYKFGALGGITKDKLNALKILNASHIGFVSLITKQK